MLTAPPASPSVSAAPARTLLIIYGAACSARAAMRRVALLTPYTLEVTTRLVEALHEHVTVSGHCLGESDDAIVARIAASATAVRDLVARDPDGSRDSAPTCEPPISSPAETRSVARLCRATRRWPSTWNGFLRNEL